jgi:ribosomal protein L30/L7E
MYQYKILSTIGQSEKANVALVLIGLKHMNDAGVAGISLL